MSLPSNHSQKLSPDTEIKSLRLKILILLTPTAPKNMLKFFFQQLLLILRISTDLMMPAHTWKESLQFRGMNCAERYFSQNLFRQTFQRKNRRDPLMYRPYNKTCVDIIIPKAVDHICV